MGGRNFNLTKLKKTILIKLNAISAWVATNVHLLGSALLLYMILCEMTIVELQQQAQGTWYRKITFFYIFNCYLINFLCYCIVDALWLATAMLWHFFILLSSNCVVRIQFNSSSVAPFISVSSFNFYASCPLHCIEVKCLQEIQPLLVGSVGNYSLLLWYQ